jgi:type II secretory pathway pseudopilin PulG
LHFLWDMATKTTCRILEGERGFSLLEVVMAAGMVAGAFAALAQVLAMSIATNTSARSGSAATVLAAQKMEQLRGLPWGPRSAGVDHLDQAGDILAEGVASPPGTVYVRRWSVDVSGDEEEIVLRVRVTGGHNGARLVTTRRRHAP